MYRQTQAGKMPVRRTRQTSANPAAKTQEFRKLGKRTELPTRKAKESAEVRFFALFASHHPNGFFAVFLNIAYQLIKLFSAQVFDEPILGKPKNRKY
jgi:hypothetical protein